MNIEVSMTLDEAVAEVMGLLTGLDLSYQPELDRYRVVTRQLNRALRAAALDNEWSYYSSVESVGTAHAGEQNVSIRSSIRPRIINDDSVRLVNADTGRPVVWAYFLPRDAVHKYRNGRDLRVAATRQTLEFSRPFFESEEGLEIHIPVMREPIMFRLPEQPEDPNLPMITVPTEIREQLVDFPYPDFITVRAAYFYAQTDPIMQPRVQTLEAQWKDIMYALTERDQRNTDTPFQNEWTLGIQSDALESPSRSYDRPHADFMGL